MFETILGQFFASFVLLFVIIDPFSSLPVFMSVTKKSNPGEKRRSANTAVSVAGALMLVFLFFGTPILSALGVSFPSFKIAGGLVLLVMGMEIVFDISIAKKDKKDSGNNSPEAAAIIIGTPLITGPGVLTTVIVLSKLYGYFIPLAAAALALAITWKMFMEADLIRNVLGNNVMEVLSRVMGLILVAMAVEFIRSGMAGA